MAAWKIFLINSLLVLFSLGRSCFVLVCSRPITWQEYEYPGMDFSWTGYKRR